MDQDAPGLSLPESLKAASSLPQAEWTEAQQKLVSSYFKKTDAEYLKRQKALADAKKPLPEDPGITRRKKGLCKICCQ